MSLVARLPAAIAVGAVAAVGVATTASATSSTSYSSGGYVRATASWNTSSNNITAGDRREDGWGAVTPWGTAGVGSSCYEGGGNGQTQTCYISVAAGYTIAYQACSIDNGDLKGCSAVKYDTT